MDLKGDITVPSWEECLPAKAGPFGGADDHGSVGWDDGCHLQVEWIFLTYTKGGYINSIQVEYRDPDGAKVLAPRHGGGGGDSFEVIQIGCVVTSVSGHYEKNNCISSLKFGTREGYIYGPYGLEQGTSFSFDVGKGICGFHGLMDGSGLRGIGVYLSSSAKQHLDCSVNGSASVESKEGLPVKAGPFGAPHKGSCVEWDDGSHLAVERIMLTYTKNNYINWIQVEYRYPTGTKVLGPKHGGGGGDSFEVIQITSTITGISGYYDSVDGKNTCIKSLKFEARDGNFYGPYGSEHGTTFCFKVEKGICGFHGLTDDFGLKAIGVYSSSTAKQHLGSSVIASVNSTSSVKVKECLPVKAGPFGGTGKDRYVEWDDGSHSAVERIFLTCTKGEDGYINSIQVEYRDPTGNKVLAPRHGGGVGDSFEEINISCAITEISGHYDFLDDESPCIRSLKFGTNGGYTYGPYGLERGTPFFFDVMKRICGFHGLTDDSGLRAIGVLFNSTAKQHLGSPVSASVSSTASIKRKEGLPVKAGPFGAPRKGGYVEWDDGCHSAVERIFLTYTEDCYINSIQVEYRDPTGAKVLAPRHGGAGGNAFEVIQMASAITWISGHYESHATTGTTFIRSLQFGTEEGYIYGSYGSETGTPFRFMVEKGICGFHGLSDGSCIRAIGVLCESTAEQHYNGSFNASVGSSASVKEVRD